MKGTEPGPASSAPSRGRSQEADIGHPVRRARPADRAGRQQQAPASSRWPGGPGDAGVVYRRFSRRTELLVRTLVGQPRRLRLQLLAGATLSTCSATGRPTWRNRLAAAAAPLQQPRRPSRTDDSLPAEDQQQAANGSSAAALARARTARRYPREMNVNVVKELLSAAVLYQPAPIPTTEPSRPWRTSAGTVAKQFGAGPDHQQGSSAQALAEGRARSDGDAS